MKYTKKALVVLSALLCSLAVSAEKSEINVSCSIESEGYLSGSPISELIDAYSLTNVPTQEGGRHLLYQNKQHELWVKNHSYMRQGGELEVTAFSVVHIDKQRKQMVEAASSTGQSPRHGTLTVHGLFDELALSACSDAVLRWQCDGSVTRGDSKLQTELQNAYSALPVADVIFLAGYKIDQAGINSPYAVFVNSDLKAAKYWPQPVGVRQLLLHGFNIGVAAGGMIHKAWAIIWQGMS